MWIVLQGKAGCTLGQWRGLLAVGLRIQITLQQLLQNPLSSLLVVVVMNASLPWCHLGTLPLDIVAD